MNHSGGIAVFIASALACVIAQPTRAQSLNQQARCAAQSQKAFLEWQRDFKSGPAANLASLVSSDYQSHYNTKLNKCLLLIEATSMLGNQSSNSALLMDAYERRPYASYLWISRENKKYWEVPPTGCELLPSLREKRNCTTREGFDAFVADYMEE
jgi:hypothetical protein